MNHTDHVDLLRPGIAHPAGLGTKSAGVGLPLTRVWADLGAGSGVFTLALADLLGPSAEIYAIDKNRGVLKRLTRQMKRQFPQTRLITQVADFSRRLDIPLLDGVVMANSLHFLRHKEAVLPQIRSYLKPGGRLILVEYNTDRGNYWVPYPLSYTSWETLAGQVGFSQTALLTTKPSRFLGQIFSALSVG